MAPPRLGRHLTRIAVLLGVLLIAAGCSTTPDVPPPARPTPIEVAFSPDGNAEALILRVIGSARQSIRLSGYSFTSPVVVRALIDAQRRHVDVRVILDDRGNRRKANISAMNLLLGASVEVRVTSKYAIHHDKFIVVDAQTVQTGSFNYTQAAARANSENVLVVWSDKALAARYLMHWESPISGAPADRVREVLQGSFWLDLREDFFGRGVRVPFVDGRIQEDRTQWRHLESG